METITEKAMAAVQHMPHYIDHYVENLSVDVFVAWNEFEIRLCKVEVRHESFHKEDSNWFDIVRNRLEAFGPDAIEVAADDISSNPTDIHFDVAEVWMLGDTNRAFVKCTHDFNRR